MCKVGRVNHKRHVASFSFQNIVTLYLDRNSKCEAISFLKYQFSRQHCLKNACITNDASCSYCDWIFNIEQRELGNHEYEKPTIKSPLKTFIMVVITTWLIHVNVKFIN